MRLSRTLGLAAALAAALAGGRALGASADMEWAQENWKGGRYADAAKRLEAVLAGADESEKPAARRFLARVYLLTGRYDEVGALFAKLEKPGVEELVLAGRAHLARGRFEKAEEAFVAALKDSNMTSATARVELLELWEAAGRREEAELARKWFFDTYGIVFEQDAEGNKRLRCHRLTPRTAEKPAEKVPVTDVEEIVAVGRGIARRDPQGAINAFTHAQNLAKAAKSGDVEAYVRSYFLFMEKYAWGLAARELAAAAALAGKHPDVLLANAYQLWSRQQNAEDAEKALDAALEVNPNLVPARVLKANLAIFDDEHAEARAELDKALAVNPRDLGALSALAAWHLDTGDAAKFEEACRKVLELNPTYADLYVTIAGSCERKRQFPRAQEFYRKAIELDPGYWHGYYGAGMALVRRGEDAEGKKLLEKAFELNKHNLFCRNMLVVLDKIVPPAGYQSQFESIETDHFVILAPRKDAAFLLPYYARCLEEAHARFKTKYGFTPENPTVVEIFSDHGQFSARTTGLPLIGADGACFGKLITLDSPRVWQAKTVPQFNWAVVAEHELMHVFSLQITDFRIPRWFTEGLSVYEEPAPRIDLDPLFASAVRNSQLIKVRDLNRQMTRPTARMNPLLAYYQAGQIVGYLYERHGAEGMKKFLAAFRAGAKLEKAAPEALGLSADEFEKAVLEHQHRFAADKVRISGAPDQATMTKLNLEVKESPNDPEKLSALASAHLQGRKPNFESAAKYAGQAVAKGQPGPGTARGHAVLGFIAFQKDKKFRKAREHFEKALALDPDSAPAHLYLGVCLGKEGQSELAVKHLLRARELSPRNIGEVNAYEELYKVYRDLDRNDEALAALRERVQLDKLGFDPAVRLARLALAAKNPELAAWAAWHAVKIDPFRVEPHLAWGEAAEALKDLGTAEREWRLAAMAEVTSVDARVGLARVLLALGRKGEAKQAADEAAALRPDRPDIKKLLDEIGPVEAAPPPARPADERPEAPPERAVPDVEKPGAEAAPEPAPAPEPGPLRKLEKVDACAPRARRAA